MKSILTIALIMIFVFLSTAGENDEFRAVWVITWEHIHSSWSVDQNKARVREILDNVKKANMNAVLWQARQSGTAYYNSSYEPWGYYAGSTYPGYDPLAYAIEEGHKRGIEVHAWFNVFAASSTAPGTPANENPEWVCRDRDGISMPSYRALSPGLDTVRTYTINVAMEIVRNYDIDGLHLDYVRWNEHTDLKQSAEFTKLVEEEYWLDGMITEEQIEGLEKNKSGRYLYDIDHPYSAGVPAGYPSWEEWWRWGVTEFVSTLHDSIQNVKPWVRLSPAALGKYNWSGWQGYGTVYQDAALWFNQGYIDQLMPMNYHWTTASGFYGMLTGNCPNCWGQWIQQGINDGRLFTVGPGSYQFAIQNVWRNHPSVINRCRDINWVDGFQFFSYGSWEDYQYWQEAGDTFFGRKMKIRDTGLISSAVPDEPSLSILKIDSLNYEITVAPNATVTDNHWFALYRSEVNGVDVDTTEIVDIHFVDSTYTILENFDGLQNFNGNYTYGATALNRYWNESSESNLVTTDLIPSFAPTIVYTFPDEGDTIAVNSNIEIQFSKEMDISTLDSAITFTPMINIDKITWSDSWPDYHKTMTINPDANFQFDTDYTLQIEPTALDVNSVALDGDSNGIAGDSFFLHFHTKAVDDEGPVVVFTYPDYTVFNNDVDVKDVITVVFSELVDHNSVVDTSMVWKQDNTELNTEYIITDVDEISIMSIGSFDTLISNENCQYVLNNTLTDTIGNLMLNNLTVDFKTAFDYYMEETIIDKFTTSGYWEQPGYSGSTSGIITSQTSFGYSSGVYLPASTTVPLQRKSAFIKYQWDTNSATHLLREYLSGGPPRAVVFDTTYILQCYIFGDGSNNKFRFCVDEADGAGWPNHEVSNWTTIDWQGWKLVEWDLSDPNTIGTWIGNGVLDGTGYRIDSFQLTWDQVNGDVSGKIYFDNLRVIKKSQITNIDHQFETSSPLKFDLSQNYPNPFNPATRINFSLASPGRTSLIVYNMLGQKVVELKNEFLGAGNYSVDFDGSNLSSGIYVYFLKSGNHQQYKKMMLIK